MNESIFAQLKERLELETENLIHTDPNNVLSYQTVLNILSEITFKNRKAEKKRLSHFIIDSYIGVGSFGSKIIEFDSQL